jgi:hypothetical protein
MDKKEREQQNKEREKIRTEGQRAGRRGGLSWGMGNSGHAAPLGAEPWLVE